VPFPSRKLPEGVRLFYVECECGEEFKAYVKVDPDAPRPERGLLVPLAGECTRCGLRLEQIEPFGAG
jgi:hypothetical protein